MPIDHDIGSSTSPWPEDETSALSADNISRAVYHPDWVDYKKHGAVVTADWTANTIDVSQGLVILQQDVTGQVSYRALDVEINPAFTDLTLDTTSGVNYVRLYVDPTGTVDPPYGIHIDQDNTAKAGADNLLLAEVDTSAQTTAQHNVLAPAERDEESGGDTTEDSPYLGGDGPTGPNQHTEWDSGAGEVEIARHALTANQVGHIRFMALAKRGTTTASGSDTDLVMRIKDHGGTVYQTINANDVHAPTAEGDTTTTAAGVDLLVTIENVGTADITAMPDWTIERETQ